jgi:hypothetical protein
MGEITMRTLSMLLFVTLCAVPARSQQMVECRDLTAGGGYLAPNETIINGKACRPAGAPLQVVDASHSAAVIPVSNVPVSKNPVAASTSAVAPTPSAAEAPQPAPVEAARLVADGKTRVFVTDSQSWETRGGSSAGGNKNSWGASSWMAGGARPQTAEIIKTLNQRCPELTVTNNLQKADFVLTLDHEGGKGLLAHRNKIAVFNRDGDDIFSNSTRELGSAVKDACQAMNSHK